MFLSLNERLKLDKPTAGLESTTPGDMQVQTDIRDGIHSTFWHWAVAQCQKVLWMISNIIQSQTAKYYNSSFWQFLAKTGEIALPGTYVQYNLYPYGKPYKEGDVIGVYVDFPTRSLAFFLNGELQGIAAKGNV
jgi:hypothetical protein